MEKVTKFLKTYWWIWLILLIISSLFLIFGASTIGNFIILVMAFLLLVYALGGLWRGTLGNAQSKTWGLFRILGFLIGFLSIIGLYGGPFEAGEKHLVDAITHPLFNVFSFGFIFSLFLYGVGEILLYFEKIQGKIEDSKNKKTMICPRCLGKGFVDLNDIKRLGKEEDWIQGCCKYCDGNGEVIKGKTTLLSPIWNDDQIEDTEFDNWSDEEE